MVLNAIFILTSDVVSRASTFALYALIARRLGASEMGQMALALTLFYALQVFAAAGVKTIVTREVAKDPSSIDHHLVSGSLLVTFGSLLSITALAAFVRMVGYSASTKATILLVSVGLLPFALTVVCEAVFQAVEKTYYIACAQVPVNLAKIGVAYLLLANGYGVHQLALLLLVCHALVAAVEWSLMVRYVTRPRLEVSEPAVASVTRVLGSSFNLARSAFTFLGIDTLIALGASCNVVLLSALADERAVGIYSAAAQLMVPVTLIYNSALLGAFPTICRRFAGDAASAMHVLARVIALLFALAVPTAVTLFFLGDAVLLLVYGNKVFVTAATALRVMVWTLIPAALTAVLGQVLFASVRERITLRIVAIDALVGLIVGVILIAKFGVVGAAVAAVAIKVVDFLQHYKPVSRLITGISLVDLCWKPVTAGACMVVYLAAARSDGFMVRAASAGVLYLAVLLGLAFWPTSNAGVVKVGIPHARPGQQ